MNTNDPKVIPIKGADKFANFLKTLSIIPILILVALFTIPSMIYTIDTNENGVVLRFGKYNRTEGPGLHFKMPWDLESVKKVPVLMILKMEFGFRTKEAGVRTVYESRPRNNESMMLTGDLNIVDVSWILQYEIKDARDYLFNVRSVQDNLYDLSLAVMREVIGDRTVTEAISESRDEISQEAMDAMQKILDDYKMGVRLVALKLQDAFPPDKVKPSFDEVNSAVQDAKQIANIAEKERQKLLQQETGNADQNIKNAEAYKIDLINRATGDAQRFLALYEEYKKEPEITKKRLYFEKVTPILKNAQKIYVVDPSVKGILPLLKLDGVN